MAKAQEPFRHHREEVAALVESIEKAYEFARGRPNNEVTTRQWEILKDPERRSLGGFLKRWEQESTLSESFIREARGLVADGFDTIIGLESGKRGAEDVQTPGGS